MSIILIHGDNVLSSRARLTQIGEQASKQGLEVISLDGGEVEVERILTYSRSETILGKATFVVVENFFSKRRKIKIEPFGNKKELLGNIVFWEGRKIPKTILSEIPANWKVEEYPLPKAAFEFLDNFIPGNRKAILKLRQAYLVEPPERILPLLAWHVRLLIWAKTEPKTLHFWKKERLIRQASHFELSDLRALHKKLLEVDIAQKTSTLPATLAPSLDQLVLALSE